MNIIPLLKEIASNYKKDNIPTFAASVAYYTAFSFIPIIVFSLVIISFFYNPDEAQSQIVTQTRQIVGSNEAQTIEEILVNVRTPDGGIVQVLFGVVLLIWSGSSVFTQLEIALNSIFRVKTKDKLGIGEVIKNRFLTFSLVGVIAFLLLVSLVATIVITFITTNIQSILPFPRFIVELINIILPFVLITILFAIIFRLLPDVIIPKKVLWIGSVLTSFLFTIGKTLIGFYLGTTSPGGAYGASAIIIVLLLWVFYSSQIFFIGAEFMKAYAKLTHKKIIPKSQAVKFEITPLTNEKNPTFLAKVLGYFAAALVAEKFGDKLKKKVK